MFDDKFITTAISRSAEKPVDRRKLLSMVGLAGAGAAAATIGAAAPAMAAGASASATVSDASVLNFALNLEYLEAEFYLRAATGKGLENSMIGGTGKVGAVTGGRKVPWKTAAIQKYANEIAYDELRHVMFLRKALGASAVARPAISLDASFTAAAQAAGLISKGQTFDAFGSEVNFLFAAFIFEDVGVTAYKGAAGLIANKTYLDAAAGLLAVEAYHAGIVRSTLYGLGVETPSVLGAVQKISDARDSLDGSKDDDQGIGTSASANLVPTDTNGLAYGRTTSQVLNVVYLNPAKGTKSGGFYPAGLNGAITTV